MEYEKSTKGIKVNKSVLKTLIKNYFIVDQKLVSMDFLVDLKEEIGEKRKFSEIRKILDKYELTDKALDLIGYKIVWNGLQPVKIIRIKNSKRSYIPP